VSFGEEKRGAFLEEKEGALHEGLSKTLESLRRGSWLFELAWRVFPWSHSFISEREHFTWRRGASRRRRRIYYPSFAHQERRTCQIEMRSDA
jgi:hypothetical protein